jgi:hypothetical protein
MKRLYSEKTFDLDSPPEAPDIAEPVVSAITEAMERLVFELGYNPVESAALLELAANAALSRARMLAGCELRMRLAGREPQEHPLTVLRNGKSFSKRGPNDPPADHD